MQYNFEKRSRELAGDSVFTSLDLQALFVDEDQQKEFEKVVNIVRSSVNESQMHNQIAELGSGAIKVLVKIAKFSLTP